MDDKRGERVYDFNRVPVSPSYGSSESIRPTFTDFSVSTPVTHIVRLK